MVTRWIAIAVLCLLSWVPAVHADTAARAAELDALVEQALYAYFAIGNDPVRPEVGALNGFFREASGAARGVAIAAKSNRNLPHATQELEDALKLVDRSLGYYLHANHAYGFKKPVEFEAAWAAAKAAFAEFRKAVPASPAK